LVPAESGLTWQANPTALATNLSIDRKVSAEIAIVGRCIQDYYEMPMDVEFVYDPALHSFCLVQARPIPPGSLKLIPPSSIAPTQVIFVKEHGDMMKTQVITPAGNAAQIITKPEEILITGNISEALDAYLHNQDNAFKAVVISEKAPQTSHEAAQFNSMGIPVLQVSANQLKNLKERMEKPDPVLIIDPQRKSIIDWTKNIKNHAKTQEEIHAAGIIEEGLFQSSLSIYESFEQLKANKSTDALKKIVSQLYHLARDTSETVEMQTLYKLILQHAVIDAAEIASAINNPIITQQE